MQYSGAAQKWKICLVHVGSEVIYLAARSVHGIGLLLLQDVVLP